MFTFKIITNGTEIEAGNKENAQKITALASRNFKIEMTDPKGGKWTFSGINAWAEASQIMGC